MVIKTSLHIMLNSLSCAMHARFWFLSELKIWLNEDIINIEIWSLALGWTFCNFICCRFNFYSIVLLWFFFPHLLNFGEGLCINKSNHKILLVIMVKLWQWLITLYHSGAHHDLNACFICGLVHVWYVIEIDFHWSCSNI